MRFHASFIKQMNEWESNRESEHVDQNHAIDAVLEEAPFPVSSLLTVMSKNALIRICSCRVPELPGAGYGSAALCTLIWTADFVFFFALSLLPPLRLSLLVNTPRFPSDHFLPHLSPLICFSSFVLDVFSDGMFCCSPRWESVAEQDEWTTKPVLLYMLHWADWWQGSNTNGCHHKRGLNIKNMLMSICSRAPSLSRT